MNFAILTAQEPITPTQIYAGEHAPRTRWIESGMELNAPLKMAAIALTNYVVENASPVSAATIKKAGKAVNNVAVKGVPILSRLRLNKMFNLDELEKLALAATPGPWKSKPSVHGNKYRTVKLDQKPLHECLYTTSELEPADANFIAALNPSDVLALIADVRGVRDAALEEAAREADGQFGIVAGVIAARIRALKSSPAPELHGWRTIDTLTREDGEVLALCPGYRGRKPHQMAGCITPGGDFRSWPGRMKYEPTHWQPLPAAAPPKYSPPGGG